MKTNSSFSFMQAVLVFFIGMCLMGGVSSMPLFKISQVASACLLLVLSTIGFLVGCYALWANSQVEEQQQLQLLIVESEQQHLLRYDRPIDAMADYAYELSGGKLERMTATRSMLRALQQPPSVPGSWEKGGL